MRIKFASLFMLAFLAAPVIGQTAGQTTGQTNTNPGPAKPAAGAQLQARLESYLRNLYAWGPQFEVKVGPLEPGPEPTFYKVTIHITYQGRPEDGTMYVTQDGRFLMRGEFDDLTADPFADTRSKLRLDSAPSVGPADASVTVVEFSDFQCPHCKLFSQTLHDAVPRYPKVRFVFKNFPLSMHAWAMTAAIAGRCIYQANPQAFWQFQEKVFEQQDLISPENVWDKMVEFASQAGIAEAAFRPCLTSPEAKQAVQDDVTEGVALGVNSTPTIYVNGRPLVGGDKDLLDQFITFEQNKTTIVPGAASH